MKWFYWWWENFVIPSRTVSFYTWGTSIEEIVEGARLLLNRVTFPFTSRMSFVLKTFEGYNSCTTDSFFKTTLRNDLHRLTMKGITMREITRDLTPSLKWGKILKKENYQCFQSVLSSPAGLEVVCVVFRSPLVRPDGIWHMAIPLISKRTWTVPRICTIHIKSEGILQSDAWCIGACSMISWESLKECIHESIVELIHLCHGEVLYWGPSAFWSLLDGLTDSKNERSMKCEEMELEQLACHRGFTKRGKEESDTRHYKYDYKGEK